MLSTLLLLLPALTYAQQSSPTVTTFSTVPDEPTFTIETINPTNLQPTSVVFTVPTVEPSEVGNPPPPPSSSLSPSLTTFTTVPDVPTVTLGPDSTDIFTIETINPSEGGLSSSGFYFPTGNSTTLPTSPSQPSVSSPAFTGAAMPRHVPAVGVLAGLGSIFAVML